MQLLWCCAPVQLYKAGCRLLSVQNKQKMLDALLLVHQAWPVWRSTLGTINFRIKSAYGGSHSPSGITLRDSDVARMLSTDYPAHESKLMSGTMPHAARCAQRLRLPRNASACPAALPM